MENMRIVTSKLIEALVESGKLVQYSATLWFYRRKEYDRIGWYGATAEETIAAYDNRKGQHEDSGDV